MDAPQPQVFEGSHLEATHRKLLEAVVVQGLVSRKAHGDEET